MAASMSTADSVNILQFMKLVGQLKVSPCMLTLNSDFIVVSVNMAKMCVFEHN